MEDIDKPETPVAEHAPESETFYVHGGLHHNGVPYPHGAKVSRSLFGSNPYDADEFTSLRQAGTLKTAAEFFPPAKTQTLLDEREAEIAELRKQLADVQAKAAQEFPKSDL